MHYAGVTACPADAAEDIKKISKFIMQRKGWEGAVREIIEIILKEK